MIKERVKLLRRLLLFLDLGITLASYSIAHLYATRMSPALHIDDHLLHYRYLLIFILPLWAVLLSYNGAYESIRIKTFLQNLWPALNSVILGGFIVIAIIFVSQYKTISSEFILLFLFINAGLLLAERVFFQFLLRYIRKLGYNYRTVLIVGTGKRAVEFARNTIDNHKEWGLKIIGYSDTDSSMIGKKLPGSEVICHIKDIPEILTSRQVDEVMFICPRKWLDKLEPVVILCEEMGISLRIACDFYPQKLFKIQLDTVAERLFLSLTPPPHYGGLIVVKRAIDVIVSIAVLVATSPLFFLISLGIKLTSPGSVFFKQERCGQYGKRFKLLKFRTMVENAEEMKPGLEHMNEMSGPIFKVRNDPRVTPIGRILRKYSLDELPQFVNVLKMNMSIVGPRPPLPDEVHQYNYSQRRRLSVAPGITCLWQVRGRSKVDFDEWMGMDLEYIDRWSIGLDFKIILKTIPAVLKGTGV